MQGEVEEAYEMLGSLDNALKAFTGRFGLEEVRTYVWMSVAKCLQVCVLHTICLKTALLPVIEGIKLVQIVRFSL